MSPTTQLVLVGVLVAVAAGYVLRAAWKTWFGKSSKGCGAGCGTCSAPPAEPKQEGRFPLPMS
jgi:hypothetical protein